MPGLVQCPLPSGGGRSKRRPGQRQWAGAASGLLWSLCLLGQWPSLSAIYSVGLRPGALGLGDLAPPLSCPRGPHWPPFTHCVSGCLVSGSLVLSCFLVMGIPSAQGLLKMGFLCNPAQSLSKNACLFSTAEKLLAIIGYLFPFTSCSRALQACPRPPTLHPPRHGQTLREGAVKLRILQPHPAGPDPPLSWHSYWGLVGARCLGGGVSWTPRSHATGRGENSQCHERH